MIYQSQGAREREMEGIKKMLVAAKLQPNEKLVKSIFDINVKFGKYHTMEQLEDKGNLMKQCQNKQEKILVDMFYEEWEQACGVEKGESC